MVGIVRALMAEPKVLLDEPMAWGARTWPAIGVNWSLTSRG